MLNFKINNWIDKEGQILIYDASGRIVKTINFLNKEIAISIADLEVGYYLLELNSIHQKVLSFIKK